MNEWITDSSCGSNAPQTVASTECRRLRNPNPSLQNDNEFRQSQPPQTWSSWTFRSVTWSEPGGWTFFSIFDWKRPVRQTNTLGHLHLHNSQRTTLYTVHLWMEETSVLLRSQIGARMMVGRELYEYCQVLVYYCYYLSMCFGLYSVRGFCVQDCA